MTTLTVHHHCFVRQEDRSSEKIFNFTISSALPSTSTTTAASTSIPAASSIHLDHDYIRLLQAIHTISAIKHFEALKYLVYCLPLWSSLSLFLHSWIYVQKGSHINCPRCDGCMSGKERIHCFVKSWALPTVLCRHCKKLVRELVTVNLCFRFECMQ